MDFTVSLPPDLIDAAEMEAANQGVTMSQLMEAALRQLLAKASPNSTSFTIPVHDLGQPRLDIANRDALYDLLDEGD